MKSISDYYNELPRETRELTSIVMLEHELRDWNLQKQKLIDAHHRHLAEMNERIKRTVKELDSKMTTFLEKNNA